MSSLKTPTLCQNPLHSDPALLLYPLQERTLRSIAHGRPPLWNPDIYGGAPLLADGQAKVFAPSTLVSPILDRPAAMEFEQWFILFVLASGFSIWLSCGSASLAHWLQLLAHWQCHLFSFGYTIPSHSPCAGCLGCSLASTRTNYQ